MSTRFGTTLLLAISLVSATTASAANLSGSLGVTGQGDAVMRASLISDWDALWYQSDVGSLTGYWDTGYSYWEGGKDYSDAHSLSFSPELVYVFNSNRRFTPYAEFGIGVALFSKTRGGEQKLGSSFNFEDRLGVGLKLPGDQRIGFRAMHYSNAGIKQPNDGIESYSFFYSRAF